LESPREWASALPSGWESDWAWEPVSVLEWGRALEWASRLEWAKARESEWP
jgi:hypothetical protein